MGRRPSPFPFPVPQPPPVQHRSGPFPPPALPSADETVNMLARRIAGVPLPLFFAIGALVGIVLAASVVSLVRRGSSGHLTRAKVVTTQAAPVVEHAHALFVWTPAIVGERARSAQVTEEQAAPPVVMLPPAVEPVVTPARPVAMRRPHAAQPARAVRAVKADKSESALPANLLTAGL